MIAPTRMRYEIENDPAVKAQIKHRLFQDLATMDQQALAGFRDAVPGAGQAGINPAQQRAGAGMPMPGAPPPMTSPLSTREHERLPTFAAGIHRGSSPKAWDCGS